MKIIATTTWNSSDVIETFLSITGSLDSIRSWLWTSTPRTGRAKSSIRPLPWFCETVPFPRIVDRDSSRILLEQAKKDFNPDTGCLFCDPDELLILPDGTGISDLTDGASAIILPRFNMTGRLSSIGNSAQHLFPLEVLNLRIQKPSRRKSLEDMRKDVLVPPWIYTAIPGKVFARLGPTLSIGDGDHTAIVSDNHVIPARAGAYLMHSPLGPTKHLKRN